MIRLWLSRGSSISIREQLSAQFVLGILSRRLAPGERLPSVRDLARRLHLHANTVSAVYQDLVLRGWVNRRHGSGIFVRDLQLQTQESNIESFVRDCIEEGLARGFSPEDLVTAFAALPLQSDSVQLLVFDPDLQLARIMAAEIGEALGQTISFADCSGGGPLLQPKTCVLVTDAHARQLLEMRPDASFQTIRLKSMQDVLAGHQRPAANALVAVASSSESILEWASKLLLALGFSPDSILLRHSLAPGWKDGLAACDIIAADSLTAPRIETNLTPITFRIVSDEFLDELREFVLP